MLKYFKIYNQKNSINFTSSRETLDRFIAAVFNVPFLQ